jgi:hypothetical protein
LSVVPEDAPTPQVQRVKVVAREEPVKLSLAPVKIAVKVVQVHNAEIIEKETGVDENGAEKIVIKKEPILIEEAADAPDAGIGEVNVNEEKRKRKKSQKADQKRRSDEEKEPDSFSKSPSSSSRRSPSTCNNIAEEMDALTGDSVGPAVSSRSHHRHSLSQDSNDSSGSGSTMAASQAPPTYSRLPPDGHEFPLDYRDPHTGFTMQQQQQLLSRKSSASSTSSLEKPPATTPSSHRLRHDEHSMKSVRDKIALFSSSKHQSTEDVNSGLQAGSMTRAYTHSDVRYEHQAARGSRTSVVARADEQKGAKSVKSVSSADLSSHRRVTPSVSLTGKASPPPPPVGNTNRSQSLMEIGSQNQTLPKRIERRSSSRTMIQDASEARQISLPPPADQRLSLTTPPWKSGQSKYSPAFKRKPFAVYNTGNVKPPPSRQSSTVSLGERRRTSKASNNDDSDTDSAVSSGRSSISHCSVSPPPNVAENPRVLKKNSVEAINRRNVMDSCKMSSARPITDFKEVNRGETQSPLQSGRNSISSLGKPASRSSSFTVAERKKSLESMSSRLNNNNNHLEARRMGSTHSSQDSLTKRSGSRDAVYEVCSSSNSRRSSRSTIGEIDEERRYDADGGNSRVTTPTKASDSDRSTSVTPTTEHGSSSRRRIVSRTNSLASSENSEKSAGYNRSNSVVSKDSGLPEEDSKWSTLEKKYSAAANSSSSNAALMGDTKNKIARFDERPKDLSLILSKASNSKNSSSSIRELAERYEKSCSSNSSRRESVVSNTSSMDHGSTCSSVIATTPTNPSFRIGEKAFVSSSWMDEGSSLAECTNSGAGFYLPEDSTEWESFDPSTPFSTPVTTINRQDKNMLKPNGTLAMKDRKYSVPIYNTMQNDPSNVNDNSNSSGKDVKMRDRKSKNAAPSRPSSLIETSTSGAGGNELKVFEIGNLGERNAMILSNSTSRGSSQADLLMDTETPLKSPLLPSSSSSMHGGTQPKTPATGEAKSAGDGDANRRCVSVNDIRRAFEKAEASLSSSLSRCSKASTSSSSGAPSHNRMSSLDSTASDESSIPTPHYYGSVSSLLGGQNNSLKDHYGSISSLASSTSLISPQELQGLIDEANMSLEESGTPSHEIMVIVLHREFTSGSIGITLAGGADYESKDITVHKVIPGTLADRDGRIQKGDRVLSINGRSTKGVTHREALSILKAPRAEVVLVLSRSRSVTPAENGASYNSSAASSGDYAASYSYVNLGSSRPPKILESPLDSKSLLSDLKFVDAPRGAPMTVVLKKEGTGLGFSLEGGKDSSLGDRPLTIKKIFTGGAADKSQVLRVGDEIIAVNSNDCTRMSRIEAWNFMKKLTDGTANIIVRQKLADKSDKTATADKPNSTTTKVDRTIEEMKQI